MKNILSELKNNAELKHAEFIEMTYEGHSNIPTIKITDGVHTGYLSPFRGYSFQVSGTKDGDGDYGSSGIIKFKELYVAINDKSMTFAIMKAAAVDAVAEWCRRFNATLPNTHIAWSDTMFRKFLKESFKWAIGEDSGII